ncbi:MAG: FAD-binding oxidoreductase [Microbacteriaceae bacterium]|nr:FAD-binding oxidoreductase [Microbacteriaceae bacterium]
MSSPTASPRNGGISHWMAALGGSNAPVETPLDGDLDVDVAIVGAGYTGLWTAYYLAELAPSLRIAVLEQERVGYGASGRNGGWLTNTITGGHDAYAKRHGVEAVRAFQHALNETVDEVIAVTAREGIDAEVVKGGSLLVARNEAQRLRIAGHVAHATRWPEEGVIELSVEEARARVNVAATTGGLWQPHCARVDPAKLAVGLADAVRRRGVAIHEGTRVTEIVAGEARTERGIVRAGSIIRATEGFTTRLPGLRRSWLPLNSSMIVTEPLSADQWAQIGWDGFETLEDLSHVYAYAQRTLDGRIAIGGRGTPYHFGSRFDSDGITDRQTWESLTALVREWFPAIADVPIAHTWSGVLGVPRNWRATVDYDPSTGLGYAGGYVGTGVTATNLAGRTLADLIAGTESSITNLPWVGQRTRRWEVEPLRWIATRVIYGAYRWADRVEFGGLPRTSRVARIADIISGR